MEVKELRDEMVSEFAEVKKGQAITNGRVREIELWKARVTGFLTAIGVLASLPSLVLTIFLIADRS